MAGWLISMTGGTPILLETSHFVQYNLLPVKNMWKNQRTYMFIQISSHLPIIISSQLYCVFKTQKKQLGMGQNPIPLVNIKIAGKWMFIPLKMVSIGIDP